MTKKPKFDLSYESDGQMGKDTKEKSNNKDKNKNENMFFNITPDSE
ncbi:hypothetical protein IMZ08_18925 [Bacillus luteolus]|uniref:Uncharacterized protein n=1 Tax=Litchfieldia luteola TaxID=682179 RepID=A0ABR9QNM5_9BACI|nr:hypothetical protein [Cytobacillus luteolus]MBE4910114.1 hypothetical protein [Cytobacillus luteolus]MBP1942322.1 hypothetical protein [Cytobacillus luteolus]